MQSTLVKLYDPHCFEGQLTLTFKIKCNFEGQNFIKLSCRKYITTTGTREPSPPRLLHGPDCFMASILYTYLYTLTASQSQLLHSLHPLQIYWSRYPRVFRHLTSLLLPSCCRFARHLHCHAQPSAVIRGMVLPVLLARKLFGLLLINLLGYHP